MASKRLLRTLQTIIFVLFTEQANKEFLTLRLWKSEIHFRFNRGENDQSVYVIQS